MIQAYGALPADHSAASGKPLDFSSQAVQPAPAKPLDFSSQAVQPQASPAQPAPAQPLDFSSQAVQPTSSSLGTALRNGAGDFLGGLATVNTMADNAIAKATGTQPDASFDQKLSNVAQNVKGGTAYQAEPMTSAGNVAHDAAGLVLGAAPAALGAAMSGPAAPLVLGASGAGNTLQSRMAQEGETSPSTGDLVAATGSGLLNAVGGKAALGLGKIPGLGALGSDAESAILRAMGRTATSAAAGGVTGAGNYVADTAGTGRMSASGLLNATGQGAATGALMAPTVDAIGAVRDLPTTRAAAAMNPEQAASTLRVSQEIADRVQAGKAAKNPTSATDAAAGLGSQLQGEVAASVGRLTQSGALSQGDRQAVIQPLIAAAQSGQLHPGDASVPTSALAQFDALDLPVADKATLRNGIIDLSTVTRDGAAGGAFKPLADKLLNTSTAKTVESLGGATLGFMHGGEPGALVGGLIGALAPKAVSSLAGGVDRLTGASLPPVLRQQAAARLALQRAGMAPPGSPLADLQAARGAYMPPSGPTPEQQGQQAAAQNQAAMIVRYGPDHPIGRAAAGALVDSGNGALAVKALAQYVAAQPIRDAAAEGKAWDTAAKHQLTLDAAEQTPGGNVGIDAINAATNQLGQQAQATQRLAGNMPQDGAVNPAQAAPAPSATPPATTHQAPPSDSTGPGNGIQPPGSGLMGLGDYLSGQALWRSGVALTPDDITAGLDRAAAAGGLSPAQYETLSQHVQANQPLHHVGGAATPALESVLQHAIAAHIGDHAPPAQSSASTATPAHAPTAEGLMTSVRYPVKYGVGATARQATFNAAVTQLGAEGMPDAAQAVRDVQHVSQPAARAEILDRLDPVSRARVRALIGGKLYGK